MKLIYNKQIIFTFGFLDTSLAVVMVMLKMICLLYIISYSFLNVFVGKF